MSASGRRYPLFPFLAGNRPLTTGGLSGPCLREEDHDKRGIFTGPGQVVTAQNFPPPTNSQVARLHFSAPAKLFATFAPGTFFPSLGESWASSRRYLATFPSKDILPSLSMQDPQLASFSLPFKKIFVLSLEWYMIMSVIALLIAKKKVEQIGCRVPHDFSH